jgi:hypothetical protein
MVWPVAVTAIPEIDAAPVAGLPPVAKEPDRPSAHEPAGEGVTAVDSDAIVMDAHGMAETVRIRDTGLG